VIDPNDWAIVVRRSTQVEAYWVVTPARSFAELNEAVLKQRREQMLVTKHLRNEFFTIRSRRMREELNTCDFDSEPTE
jgi:hypothetical protein